MDDSLRKVVNLNNSVPLKASRRTMLLSDVANRMHSPLGLNFIIFISL